MRHDFCFWFSISWIRDLLCTGAFSIALGTCAQTNILYNGSFEVYAASGMPLAGWGGNNLNTFGYVNNPGAADGRNFIVLETGGAIWQDLPTVSGRDYIVRFAIGVQGTDLRVFWGGALIGEVTFAGPASGEWLYTNFTGTTTSSVSRVQFQVVSGTLSLDAVSVGWLEEPPSIITQVPSRSTFEGGTVTFPIVAIGGPPLAYQWYFDGGPISDATNRVLTVTNAQKSAEGAYVVIVTNSYGQISSLPANLVTHQIPDAPLIVAQPKSLQTTAGYFGGFYVFAVSSQPLSYQWLFNETNDLPNATNAHFTLPEVAQSDAGQYSVVVSNKFGRTVSLPASLSVVTGYGGGVIVWDNYNPPDVDAPVFDVDGSTLLAGTNYSAQLYAGATSNVLHAVGVPATFQTGDFAGYYLPYEPAPIPDVPAGQNAYVQLRVWDNSFGSTFEEARALGGRFGQSGILVVFLTGPPPAPTPLRGLWKFSLQAGEPVLATAKLYPGGQTPGGDREWLLVGDIGAQYVVEHRSPPNNWSPLLVVTNLTGTVAFVDTNAQNSSQSFYRARILEQ